MAQFWRVTILLASAILLGASLASAQQLSISGTIDDTYGVVPDASVTLRTQDGAVTKTTGDAQGHYAFDGLVPGTYEVSVAREGFVTATRAVPLTTQSRTVDLTITIAGFVASVDVVDVGGGTTASRMNVPNREIPSQVSVVSATTLQEQGINDLAAALENVSGVITQVQYGVYEWYTIGGVTQQSGNDFLYQDGMTLTGNRSNTQLNNIEQVEVFKGPNAVLYGGAGASQGGMVNVISKKPQAGRAQDAMAKFGNWGQREVGAGTAGQILGAPRLLYRTDLSFSYTDAWRQGGSKRFNVSPALTWLITDQMRLTFNESFIHDSYKLDAGVPKNLLDTGFVRDRRLNPPGDFQLTEDWRNQIVFSWNITKTLQFRNSFFTRRNRDQYLDAETLSYNATTDILSRAELYFQHNRRPIQNHSDLVGDRRLAGMRHRFMVGADYNDQYNYSNRIGNAPGANNNLSIPIPSIKISDFLSPGFVDPAPIYTSFPRTRVDYSDNIVTAGSWQDQIDVTDRLRVNLAGRYDDYLRRTHNDTYDNDVFVSAGPVTGRHQTAYTYRYGGVYSLTDKHWVYASTATTFQPVFTIPADGKELEPTSSRSVEVGYKFEALRGRVVATSAFRRILNENLLIPLGGNLFEQAGKSSSRVLDFDLEGNFGHGFRATASYGFADPQYDDFKSSATGANLAGNQLAQAPRHMSRAWGTKTMPLNRTKMLSASLGGRYVSQYFTNSANTVILPSRLTFDGAIGVRMPTLDITLNLVNLTNNEDYFVSQINTSQFYPGAPFNASVTIRYRFK